MKKSYVEGSTDTPLVEITVGNVFDEAVERWADRKQLISCHENISWTWSQFGERVDSFAKGLLERGFLPGDRLGIWAMNCADWTVTQFASAKIGVILVNINPAYRIAELEFVLNNVDCKGLVTGVKFKSSDYIEMLRELLPELDLCVPGKLYASRVPTLRSVIRLHDGNTDGMISFEDIVDKGQDQADHRLHEIAERLNCHDPLNIQFTSGTTGAPKGATLTHFNILNNATTIGNTLNYTPEDRVCITVPLYHCFGMVIGNLTSITHGVTVVYPDETFTPVTALEAVHNHGCTSMYGVPTMFMAILEHPDFDRYDLTSLRTGVMAGAPCPIELMKKVVSDFHLLEMTIAYGMTETSPVSFQSSPTDPVEKRVGTVGRICAHTRAKIVDSSGVTVPIGEQGEILINGYLVMNGYWNDGNKTNLAIDEEGWMRTGDLGVLSEDGWLSITGRAKDLVIRGGENAYPVEIEEFLFCHPQIRAVQIFGVPDNKYGKEIVAWIKLRQGEKASEEDIRDYCRGRIAHYKIPKYIRFLTSSPRLKPGDSLPHGQASCFSAVSLRSLETAGLTSAPQAFTANPAARMFLAALTSR